jgi:hypothetical protein
MSSACVCVFVCMKFKSHGTTQQIQMQFTFYKEKKQSVIMQMFYQSSHKTALLFACVRIKYLSNHLPHSEADFGELLYKY